MADRKSSEVVTSQALGLLRAVGRKALEVTE